MHVVSDLCSISGISSFKDMEFIETDLETKFRSYCNEEIRIDTKRGYHLPELFCPSFPGYEV